MYRNADANTMKTQKLTLAGAWLASPILGSSLHLEQLLPGVIITKAKEKARRIIDAAGGWRPGLAQPGI